MVGLVCRLNFCKGGVRSPHGCGCLLGTTGGSGQALIHIGVLQKSSLKRGVFICKGTAPLIKARLFLAHLD
jgi:hypothetical protein